jgi:hypothetical protein
MYSVETGSVPTGLLSLLPILHPTLKRGAKHRCACGAVARNFPSPGIKQKRTIALALLFYYGHIIMVILTEEAQCRKFPQANSRRNASP